MAKNEPETNTPALVDLMGPKEFLSFLCELWLVFAISAVKGFRI
jgi:hypothetical protein